MVRVIDESFRELTYYLNTKYHQLRGQLPLFPGGYSPSAPGVPSVLTLSLSLTVVITFKPQVCQKNLHSFSMISHWEDSPMV